MPKFARLSNARIEERRQSGYLSDALVVQPGFAGSLIRVLIRGYTGSLFQARRDGGSPATLDFGSLGSDLDYGTFAAWAAGVNVFLVRVYDQKAAGDFVQTGNTAAQPKLWDASTGPTLMNSKLAALWDGTNDVLDGGTPSAYGVSTGNAAITIASAYQGVVGGGRVAAVGGNAANSSFSVINGSLTTTQIGVSISTSQRYFTATDTLSPHTFVGLKPASVTVANMRCFQNGVELAQSSVVNGTNNLSLVNTRTRWGGSSNSATTDFINGKCNFLCLWGSELSASDLAVVETEARKHF